MSSSSETANDVRRALMTSEERQMEVNQLLCEESQAIDRLRAATAALLKARTVHETTMAKLEEARGYRRSIGEETSLTTLPSEILSHIFSKLPLADRSKARVNRRLCRIEQEAGPLTTLEFVHGDWEIEGEYNKMTLRELQYSIEDECTLNNAKSCSLDFNFALSLLQRMARTQQPRKITLSDMDELSEPQWKQVCSLLSDVVTNIESLSIGKTRHVLPWSDLHQFMRGNIKTMLDLEILAVVKITGEEMIEMHKEVVKMDYPSDATINIACSSVDPFVKWLYGVESTFIKKRQDDEGLETIVTDAEIYTQSTPVRMLHRKELNMTDKGGHTTLTTLERCNTKRYKLHYIVSCDDFPPNDGCKRVPLR